MKRRQVVGRIVGVHGLRGELKVEGLVDQLDRFDDFTSVGLSPPDQEGGDELQTILAWRVHKGQVLLSLEGCDDRSTAEGYRGFLVWIPFEQRQELEEGRFFIDDLLGLAVRGPEGESVGEVVDFQEQGTGVLEVRKTSGKRFSIPFARDFVAKVDVTEGVVVVTARYRELDFSSASGRRGARRTGPVRSGRGS